MGKAQGPTGFKPAQPKPPTDLEKELAAAPPYPGVYEALRVDLGDRADAFIRDAARNYFTYVLLLGGDKAQMQADPYWKYMEE